MVKQGLEGIESAQAGGLRQGLEDGKGLTAGSGLAALRNFPGDDRWTQRALSGIIGRLNGRITQEAQQVAALVMLDQTLLEAANTAAKLSATEGTVLVQEDASTKRYVLNDLVELKGKKPTDFTNRGNAPRYADHLADAPFATIEAGNSRWGWTHLFEPHGEAFRQFSSRYEYNADASTPAFERTAAPVAAATGGEHFKVSAAPAEVVSDVLKDATEWWGPARPYDESRGVSAGDVVADVLQGVSDWWG